MKSLWETSTSAEQSALDECVQGSRTIGAHESLVLHGGGNSSIKDTITDVTDVSVDVLYVKGSGWDMATIEPAGFTPLRMSRLTELLSVDAISDPALVNELRCARLDASSPDPSIESLLHAMLPYRAVLHSHADAIVSLTNQPEPAAAVDEVFGERVVVIPYVMPGFDLARLCNELWPQLATQDTVGMILLNHGLFTFGDTMEEAYSRHIELITAAEDALREAAGTRPSGQSAGPIAPLRPVWTPEQIARMRNSISAHAGRPMIVSRHTGERVAAFVAQENLEQIATRGPATPDHIIRTKRVPLIGTDIDAYVRDYVDYFERNQSRSAEPLAMIDPTPRFILDRNEGLFTTGKSAKDADIVRDIALHTFDIIDDSERLGRYTALDESDLFDVEYWDLEQAKLRLGGAGGVLTGQIALVTGAASGIGRAIAGHLLELGACVVGIDISTNVESTFAGPSWLGIPVDVRDGDAIADALSRTVERFGGLDMLVVAAGVFAESAPITGIGGSSWGRTFAINVDSVQTLFGKAHPLLALSATYGRVVVVGSKNVAAPGPGAAAYSASKAALTQLTRVAALEWAGDGIRVNIVHPDAVFDTALWTPGLLAERAAKYAVSIDDYKRRNLLSTEVTSHDVARMVGAMCTATFQSTTGAQVPVDGGNDRVV
ncbi:bifunctional aldolase/short-chain dehydrogenase [Glaciibacter sp. 2TAF33]|uniref:bifunctional aldolase/short-chain dehydrogenase n=1 Tax=Glaciibacter sp. 2TAF33 TaxID=3233015 RepID=UPI003F9286A9